MRLYDKNNRPIEPGDILKVYHFTGARKKRYFMYQQASQIVYLGPLKLEYLEILHLDLSPSSYFERLDNRTLQDYEIVQGLDIDFTKRPKKI